MNQFSFNDGKIKSRLVRNGQENWFTGEWKYVHDLDENGRQQFTGKVTGNDANANIWFPWIFGTREWLGLSDDEIKNAYPSKTRK